MDVVQPRPHAGPPSAALPVDPQALRFKLRELIWRMDQVREQLDSPQRALDDATLALVLDTTDAKTLLGGGTHGFR